MAYVYRHINLDTNKPFYIGVGADNKGWFTRAKNKGNRNYKWKHLVSVISDYRVEILLNDLDYKEALDKEKEFILLYGRHNLCNLTNGGEGNCGNTISKLGREAISKAQKGRKRTPEQLLQMSIRAKEQFRLSPRIVSDETKQKMRERVTGFRHTDEAKKRVSLALTGIKRSDEFKSNVSKYWTGRKRSAETGEKISKAKTGCKYSDQSKQNLKNAWANMDPEKRRERCLARAIKIKAFDIDTKELIGEFDSIAEASIQLKISHSAIQRRLDALKQTPSRYLFEYSIPKA